MTIVINEQTDKYTEESIFSVSIAEADCMGRVKPVVLLNYMQDVADKSINKVNLGYEDIVKKGLGWFLIRYRVEFDSDLKNIEELKVQTENRGSQKIHAYRDFEVFDNITGNRVLRAATSWFLVDVESKSLVNISQDYPKLIKFEKREDDLNLQKLKSPESFDFEKSFSVRYDDLDVNKHVNNTVYIGWALEALDFDYRNSHSLKILDIYYKHEAKYGDEILSQVKFCDDCVTEHVIRNSETGEELCLLKMKWNI